MGRTQEPREIRQGAQEAVIRTIAGAGTGAGPNVPPRRPEGCSQRMDELSMCPPSAVHAQEQSEEMRRADPGRNGEW